jgi:hypothetical protein
VRVFGEERNFVAVAEMQLTFAFSALEFGRCKEPTPRFHDQVAAVRAWQGEVDVA